MIKKELTNFWLIYFLITKLSYFEFINFIINTCWFHRKQNLRGLGNFQLQQVHVVVVLLMKPCFRVLQKKCSLIQSYFSKTFKFTRHRFQNFTDSVQSQRETKHEKLQLYIFSCLKKRKKSFFKLWNVYVILMWFVLRAEEKAKQAWQWHGAADGKERSRFHQA